MAKLVDISNQKFGLLTALTVSGKDKTGKTKWLCRCDCGKTKEVTMLNLKSKNTKSCGCMKNPCGMNNKRTVVDTSVLSMKKQSYAMRRHWRKSVIERDGACKKCGTNENLQAHHLKGTRDFPSEMLDVNNGATLCFRCHLDFHIKYGRKTGFTPENYQEFVGHHPLEREKWCGRLGEGQALH